MSRTCSSHKEERKSYSILVKKSEAKEPLGRPRIGWMALKWNRRNEAKTPLLGTWVGTGGLLF